MSTITVKDREYPIEEIEVPEGTMRFVTATVQFDDDDTLLDGVLIAIGAEFDEAITNESASDELLRIDQSIFFYCQDEDEFIDLAGNGVAGMEWRIV
jgi:hypothetical protein